MARCTPSAVWEKISANRILPLFNIADPAICASVIDACYAAGIRVFELTNRDLHAVDVFHTLQQVRDARWPELCLGAGTILDAPSARLYIGLGADFIIAPDLNPEVGAVCAASGVPWIPGCFSPSEISRAYQLGATVVKLFPASAVGPSYIRQIYGPMPFAKIIVTGGVETDEVSLRSWLDAGAFALGVGSSLFKRERVLGADFGMIQQELEKIVRITSLYGTTGNAVV